MARKRSEAGSVETLTDRLVAKTVGICPNCHTLVDSEKQHSLGDCLAANERKRLEAAKSISGTRVPENSPKVEIEVSDRVTYDKPNPPPLYASRHLGEGVNEDFQRIVETLYAVDAFKDYSDLEKNLEVGDQRGDYMTLREHLDKAEARARRAHKLFMGAKLELVKWELDSKKVIAGMRQRATEALQTEKESGDRTKRITNDDVESKMSDMFPDEVHEQEIRRAKFKGVCDDLEHLTRRWDMKCGDLRTLIETLRK